jgi:hypothetical protein
MLHGVKAYLRCQHLLARMADVRGGGIVGDLNRRALAPITCCGWLSTTERTGEVARFHLHHFFLQLRSGDELVQFGFPGGAVQGQGYGLVLQRGIDHRIGEFDGVEAVRTGGDERIDPVTRTETVSKVRADPFHFLNVPQ